MGFIPWEVGDESECSQCHAKIKMIGKNDVAQHAPLEYWVHADGKTYRHLTRPITEGKEQRMNAEQLDDRVRELAVLRKTLEEVKAAEEIREAIVIRSGEYGDFMEAQAERKKIEDRIRDAETWIRVGAIDVYKATGEKKFPGVWVEEHTLAEYEPSKAVAWCAEHYHDGLTLNKKAFEKVAEVMKPDFVAFKPDPRAKIASDLSKILEGE